ncbi:MAG: hypothetical protein LT106_16495 [Burkholderiaceae bacterium]|nr:hypothetical protein [Burkholderiaceae bacterium]
MRRFEHDFTHIGASTGSTRHRDVLARLLAITRQYFGALPPMAQPGVPQLAVCDGAGFEDRLQASLVALGRDDTRVAGAPAWGRAPLRALEGNREGPVARGPEGGLVGWIEFDALERVEPGQAERAAEELRTIVRERVNGCVGGGDLLGRYNAESFAWARLGAMPLERAVALADAMLESLSTPARVAGANRDLRPSLGFTYFPQDGSNPALLLTRACASMRRARHYRMGYAFYSPILDAAFASPVGLARDVPRDPRRASWAGGTPRSAMA